jgi:hypothetical protein
VSDEIDRHRMVTLRGPIRPGTAGDAVRRSRPAPRVDPGLKAFGVPLWRPPAKGKQAAPPTATMPTGGAGRHQFHRSQLRGRRRLAPVDESRLSAPCSSAGSRTFCTLSAPGGSSVHERLSPNICDRSAARLGRRVAQIELLCASGRPRSRARFICRSGRGGWLERSGWLVAWSMALLGYR